MIIVCSHCRTEYEYDAARYDYEPFQCPECCFINFVLDWDETDDDDVV